MATKPNGDPLEGTQPPPSNYPDPVKQNVNMQPMSAAYFLTGDRSQQPQSEKDQGL